MKLQLQWLAKPGLHCNPFVGSLRVRRMFPLLHTMVENMLQRWAAWVDVVQRLEQWDAMDVFTAYAA